MFRQVLATFATLAAATHAKDLVDSPALAGAAIPPGVALKIEADFKNQQLASPTALTFDDQGRILITETHRFAAGIEDDRAHLYWYLDDLAAAKTIDRRALHEKWKEKLPLARLTEKSEIVRRLADTNGDGTLDECKVFADGFNDVLDGTAAGIFAHEGAVYLGCIPKLLMLRDTDGNGTADERKTIAEGFGVRVSLSGHDLNGFALGPDGRIYGTIGDRGFNFTTKEGVVCNYPNQGAVFRFEPDGSGFEVIHTGLRNPKEIAFDALGYPFTVDNNSDQGDSARVVYIVEGGDSGWEMEHQTMFSFHRQIGLKDLPPSRWMDEKMWHLANPEQPAFMVPPIGHVTSGPSGLTYHPGAGFLESEAGRFLICDYRGSAANSGIWSFETKPEGAGMKLTDSRKLVSGVAATDVEYSWDGRVLVTDFGGGWKSHDEGRLLSLDAGPQTWLARDAASTAKIMREGFGQRSSAELVNLLKHPDARIRLRAQITLTRKPDALKRFTDATDSSDVMVRVHSIWGLGILARRGSSPLPVSDFSAVPSGKIRKDAEDKLVSMLKDKSEEIRCQVLRTLADASTTKTPLSLGPLLGDPSPRVRYFAAILAGKRGMIGYYGPICDLLAENDNRDPLLRHAGAFALQHISPNSDILRALSYHDSAAVRLAAVVALRRMKSPDMAEFIRDRDPKVADEAIRGICDLDLTLQRRSVAVLMDALEKRQWSPLMLRRLLHNSFRIGGTQNAARVLNFATDPSQLEDLRKEAFRLVSEWTKPFPADQFTGHWDPVPERDSKEIVPLLIEALPALVKQNGFVLTAALGLIDIYHINIAALDAATLRGFVTNAALPSEARSKALDLIIGRKPEEPGKFLTETIRDAPDEVALTALGHLAKISPASAIAPVEAALASSRPLLSRKSWELLAPIPGEAADALFVKQLDLLRAANGISPHAIELMDAAKTRSAPGVAAALSALEKSLAENKDPLAKWNIALEGGDPEAGNALFVSHPAGECMRCHRVGEGHDIGGITAPNLAGVANRNADRRYFLESLLTPSAVIAPGFGVVAIDFKNGASLNGNLIASAAEHLDLDYKGKTIRIQRADIASVSDPVSAMPPMGEHLKPAELRDLTAWLASLRQESAATPAAVTPEPFDPATLTISETSTSGIDPAILKTGRTQFIICAACHGQNAEGTGIAPPLAGSEWVNGPAENLIRIQLRGLQGPLTVKGQTYNFPAGMAALAYQTDEQIAAVLTYVRNSFGNSAPAVTPAQVAALRGEAGKPPLTAADLVPPVANTPPTSPPANKEPAPAKYDDLRPASDLPKWLAAALVFAGTLVFILRKLRSKDL
jgi:quinoprotein glucose dehydrogenase